MKKTIYFLLATTAWLPVVATEQQKMPWYKSIFFGSGSEKVTLSTMNYEQLCDGKKRALESNDRMVAIKYLERMAKLCPSNMRPTNNSASCPTVFLSIRTYLPF